MSHNIFKLFLDKLLSFPLWIKQIIYFKLYQNLKASLSDEFILTDEKNMFQIYVPTLSFLGKTELEERKKGLDSDVYTFLEGVDSKLNILELAMNNFWTIEEVAKNFITCLDQDLLKMPESIYVYATAGLISGKFRTGEYFKRVGRINVNQLEYTIIKQKEYAATSTPKKMAELLIEFGYLTEKECKSLLMIKEESKKRFILDGGVVPDDISAKFVSGNEYKEQIARLTEQNAKLREQLTKLLAFVKKSS